MLKSLRIHSLFGRFNYYLDFSKHRMTILTGPNGFGKTTILRIIRNVLDDNLYDLYQIPFEEIELRTDDDKVLVFKKIGRALFLNEDQIFIPCNIDDSYPKNITFTLNGDDVNLLRTKYKKFVLQQQALVVSSVGHSDSSVAAGTEDVVARINSQILGKPALKFVDDLLDFYSSVGNSIFCGADRLYRDYLINDGGRSKKKLSDVIGSLSSKLDYLFNYYNEGYTSLSTFLDYSFISSLIKEIDKSGDKATYSEEQFIADSALINGKIDKLVNYGFLSNDGHISDSISFKTEYGLVFKVFTQNYKRKIAFLEKLIDKLDLFIEIVNSKLINKSIEVKKDKKGNTITARDGNNVIPLQNLSSGEQEIVVLYFKLIFEIQDNLIALIDEPELSSHVSWQYEILDDFERIFNVNENIKQMIVCTHSPQIINEKWDQTIDLFEIGEKNNE